MWKTCLYLVVILAIFTVVTVTYAVEFTDPINAKSFPKLLKSIADAILIIAVPLAVIAIIITGVRFVIAGSQGDSGQLKTVRSLFWWILVGTAIIVGGAILVKAVVKTIENFGS